jgi:hypothetical protein
MSDEIRQKLRELYAADDEDQGRGEAALQRLRQREVSSKLVYKTMPVERQPPSYHEAVDTDARLRALLKGIGALAQEVGGITGKLRRRLDELEKKIERVGNLDAATKFLLDREFAPLSKEVDAGELQKQIETLRGEMLLIRDAIKFETNVVEMPSQVKARNVG